MGRSPRTCTAHSPATTARGVAPAGHRHGPGRHARPRRRRLVRGRPLGRRGRHRRHALPRRLGDDGAGPAPAQRARRHPPPLRGHARHHRQPADRAHPADGVVEEAGARRRSRSRGCTSRSTGSSTRTRSPRSSRSLQRVLRDVRESVEDWRKMRDRALAVVDEHRGQPAAARRRARSSRAVTSSGGWPTTTSRSSATASTASSRGRGHGRGVGLRAVPGTGLGILRADQDMSTSFAKLPALVKDKAREKTLLVLAKANSRATVHRPAYLDYVGVKTFDDNGEVVGERRFLGLFSSAAYTESVTRIPLLREKTAERHAHGRLRPAQPRRQGADGHARELPARRALPHAGRGAGPHRRGGDVRPRASPAARCSLRRDTYGRYVSVLVYLPRDRYNTTVRERFAEILTERLNGESVEFTARVNESTTARVHFVVHPPKGETIPDFDVADLERRMVEAARSWRDDFTNAVLAEYGEERGSRLARTWSDAFPEAYKEDFNPRTGAADLGRLEAIEGDEGIDLALFEQVDAGRGEARLKVFRVGPPLSLSEVLPMLSSMGVEVVDERPYELDRARPRVLHLRVRAALRPAAARHRPQALRRRAARGVGRLQRDRRLQRARARRRPDVAPGDRAARLREVHEAGQLAVRARLHRGRPAQQRRHHPAARRPLRGPLRPRQGRPPGRRRGPHRADRGSWRTSSPRPSTTWSASTTTGSCGPTSPTSAARCAPTTSRRPPTGRCTPTSPSSSSRRRSPTCPSRGRSSRSSSTRPASRACTCASAPSPAAACAGPTDATTSAPRCSAWSRRRWSRTP